MSGAAPAPEAPFPGQSSSAPPQGERSSAPPQAAAPQAAPLEGQRSNAAPQAPPPQGAQPPLAEARGVSARRGGRLVLEDVSCSLRAGRTTVLVGPNGAGKTTLLRLLLGLERPSSGRVSRARGLRVGYVPQEMARDPVLPMSADAFLASAASRPRADERAAALESAGLAGLGRALLPRLSGGEWRRLLLARALVGAPGLLVLDEPDQNLDLEGCASLYRHLDRVRAERRLGILLVSHSLSVVMAAADRVLCLDVRVRCEGSPAEVARDGRAARLFGLDAGLDDALVPWPHRHRGRAA